MHESSFPRVAADPLPRYLAENLTPEWKRAYIDYRACKKAIKVIANRLGDGHPDGQVGDEADKSSDGDDGDGGPSAPPRRSLSTRTGPGSTKSGPESGRIGPMSPASGTHPESRGGLGSPANGVARSNVCLFSQNVLSCEYATNGYRLRRRR